MKIFYLSLWLLVSGTSLAVAQTTPKQRGYKQLSQVEAKVVYTDVIEATGLTQSELFDRAKQWLVRSVTGAADTTRTLDRAAGMLTARGVLQQPPLGVFKDPNTYEYYFTVYVKDGKCKYQVDRIQWTYSAKDVAGKVAVGPFTRPIEYLGTLHQPHFVQERAAYLDDAIKQLLASLDASMVHRGQGKVSW